MCKKKTFPCGSRSLEVPVWCQNLTICISQHSSVPAVGAAHIHLLLPLCILHQPAKCLLYVRDIAFSWRHYLFHAYKTWPCCPSEVSSCTRITTGVFLDGQSTIGLVLMTRQNVCLEWSHLDSPFHEAQIQRHDSQVCFYVIDVAR